MIKTVLAVLLTTTMLSGTTAPVHHYLIQLSEGNSPERVQRQWTNSPGLNEYKVEWELLSKRINTYRLTFSADTNSIPSIIENIRSLSGVEHIKEEVAVNFRTTIPNDEQYNEQFYLPMIEAQEAWDQTTGGVTAHGDSIVIAILDSGFDIEHEDLQDNLWKNKGEIPGNGMDDDGNGYADDVYGYNFSDDSGSHPVRYHGTAVAGLLGAKGDNSKGITGVNWDVQLMFLTIQNEGDVIQAYEYVLDQKSLYLQSDGQEGAYVVVTNLSAGIDMAWPEEFPMWCDMYEELLNGGILSACAAPNLGINIDLEGDIPGTCPSNGTIIVTNTDRHDVKLSSAGYGQSNVDISAPGEDVLSLDVNNGYEMNTGTSFSAPLVTGSIALLHSVDCGTFAQYFKDRPKEAALALKDIVLRTVDPVQSLDNITVSEGRLNLKNAILDLAEARCGAQRGPVMIREFQPNPAREKIEFKYQVPDYQTVQWRIVDMQGRVVMKETVEPPAFEPKKIEISVLNLSTGMYFLDFMHPEQHEVRKFVVQ